MLRTDEPPSSLDFSLADKDEAIEQAMGGVTFYCRESRLRGLKGHTYCDSRDNNQGKSQVRL